MLSHNYPKTWKKWKLLTSSGGRGASSIDLGKEHPELYREPDMKTMAAQGSKNLFAKSIYSH